jgi:hypothetical protein
MPSTYTLISSNVLSSSAASVTFSAIPATFTDLVIRASIRGDWAGLDTPSRIQFNTGLGSGTALRSQYSSGVAQSFRDTAASPIGMGWVNSVDSTANTFASCEIYIPNYSNTSTTKPFGSIYMVENNASQAHGWLQASWLNTTSAITSITLSNWNGNLVAGSSFYLYGIKNS